MMEHAIVKFWGNTKEPRNIISSVPSSHRETRFVLPEQNILCV